mgnify:CR=1 FL=1
MSLDTLRARVRRQRADLPVVYGDVDFDLVPERLALEPDAVTDFPTGVKVSREELLADGELVELMATATMLGDVVCDAYVCLLPELGMHRLIELLRTACRDGIEAVEDPPAELVAFVDDLVTVPDWIDLDLVERGGRTARISAALAAPFAIRGAFLATFMNEYAALPMALTGSLSDKRAARRVNETASFFAATALPGGLRPGSEGFEAAAMVRLMHSMVRYNALRRSDRWDQARFGIPIPQVDQMPAGLIGSFLLAAGAIRAGRETFTDDERAEIELSRYRCHLLGLPEELLPVDPHGIVKVFLARAATLRKGYDDATCGELARATLRAELRPGRSLPDRIAEDFERSFSKAFVLQTFLRNEPELAEQMGVRLDTTDRVRVAVAAPFVIGRLRLVSALDKLAPLRLVTDPYVTCVLRRRLRSYGTAEYRTDAGTYRHARPSAEEHAPAG